MSVVARRYIPWMFVVVVFTIVAIDTIAVDETIHRWASDLISASTVIGAFAVLLSIVMLSRLHIRRILRRRTVLESSILLICMWITLIWGGVRFFIFGISPTIEPVVQNLFYAITAPGDATMFSILAFFIASAAYRAFRLRNTDAGILIAVAIIAMLAKAPIGEAIFGKGIIAISDFCLNVGAKAGRRVFMMAMVLAVIALDVRILLGYERGWMGRGAEEG